jgi:hypothetical protein
MRLLSGENQESDSGKANTSKDLRFFLSGEWSFIFREDTKKPGSNLPGSSASRGECRSNLVVFEESTASSDCLLLAPLEFLYGLRESHELTMRNQDRTTCPDVRPVMVLEPSCDGLCWCLFCHRLRCLRRLFVHRSHLKTHCTKKKVF